ncbi:MAG TPA: DUF2298 domain-containing protein [Ktedonobacterales bacterium]
MSVTFVWWLFIEALGLAGMPLAATVLRHLPDRGWALSKPLSLLMFGWLVWFPLSIVTALPFSRSLLIGAFILYVAGNVALVVNVRSTREALAHLARESWDYLLLTEALFAGAFGLMLWIRSFLPAVVDTEKFMDVAFLSAIWRAPHLPPPDPWLSGYSINYYYFGHYLMALVAKTLGTPPSIAFNLAVALIFGLAAVAIYGMAVNLVAVARGADQSLVPASLAGVISVALTLIAGDFNGAQVWLKNAMAAVKTDPTMHGNIWAWWSHRELWLTYDWWTPSRVAPNTINEFPAFSFILADLHAHVLALPFAALAVGLAFNLLLARERGLAAFGARLWPLGLLVYSVALGGLYLLNGWDLPTYVGLAILALALQQWLAAERTLGRALLLDLARGIAALLALVVVLYLPFYLTYSSPSQGVGVVPGVRRTPVGFVWDFFATLVFLSLSYLALRLGPWLKDAVAPSLIRVFSTSGDDRGPRWLATTPGVALGAIPLAVLAGLTWRTNQNSGWTLFWVVIIVGLCAGVLIWWTNLHGVVMVVEDSGQAPERTNRADMMTILLIGVAAALIGACELVFLRDVFSGGPYGALGDDFRMNTVFKFYYQVWLLLGIISGPVVVWVASAFGRVLLGVETTETVGAAATLEAAPALATVNARHGGADTPREAQADMRDDLPPRDHLSSGWRWVTIGVSWVWVVGLCWLLAAAAMYPTLAVAARTDNLSLSHSLDGTAYMAQDAMNAGDAQAIAWLNSTVQGSPVILEAAQYNEYTHLGRVSAFTGLPTLIGWGGHEEQWRFNWLAQPGRANVLGERLNAVKLIYTSADPAFTMSMLRAYHVRYVYVGAGERLTYGPQADHFSTFLVRVYSQAGVTIYEVPGV